jgi:formylglycine-generating enzyme required for sulfatase activity
MNTNVFKGFFVGLFIFFAQACVNESYENCPTVEDGGRTPVKFVASNTLATRTSVDPSLGTVWTANDSIGVYMLRPTKTITHSDFRNKAYAASQGGATSVTFSADDANKLYYGDDQPYKFISYYPYKKEGTNPGDIRETSTLIYPIDISNQEDPSKIDVLYSDNVVSHALTTPVGSSDEVTLTFKHVLSKIVINVKGDGSLNHYGMRATYNGLSLTADMDLGNGDKTAGGVTSTGGDISTIISNPGPLANANLPGIGKPTDTQLAANAPSSITIGDYDTTYQAIVIPHDIDNTGLENIVFFSGGNRQFTWKLAGLISAATPIPTFAPGKVYTFWVELTGATPVVIIGSIEDWTKVDIADIIHIGEGQSGDTATYVYPNRLDSIPVTYIAKGDFIMGSWRESNSTKHPVTISQGFQISRVPVTNAQYAFFLNKSGVGSDGKGTDATNDVLPGTKGLLLANTTSGTTDFGLHYVGSAWVPVSGLEKTPAVGATWLGARAYARWAGGSHGGNDPDPSNYYANGDIPTEAQWEYAARANVDTAFIFMDGTNTGADMELYAQIKKSSPQPVGQLKPNAWNLYDMYGNVWEYTRDLVSTSQIASIPDYGTAGVTDPGENPPAPSTSLYPLCRGDHFNALSIGSTFWLSHRHVNWNALASTNTHFVGFRVVFR